MVLQSLQIECSNLSELNVPIHQRFSEFERTLICTNFKMNQLVMGTVGGPATVGRVKIGKVIMLAPSLNLPRFMSSLVIFIVLVCSWKNYSPPKQYEF